MKKRVSTKRLFAIVLAGIFVGAGGSIGIYLHSLGATRGALFDRGHQLRFCGRCGYKEWLTSTGILGFEISRHDPLAGQKKDFAGIDQSSCEHVFFLIGKNDTAFAVPDFKMYRSSFGTLSNNAVFERPILVETYRALEKENSPGDAVNVFYHLIVAATFRSIVPTNLAQALNGTNTQALVEVLYQSSAASGLKVRSAKRK